MIIQLNKFKQIKKLTNLKKLRFTLMYNNLKMVWILPKQLKKINKITQFNNQFNNIKMVEIPNILFLSAKMA